MGKIGDFLNSYRTMRSGKKLVSDFERRTPYWSYRPANYKIYEPFANYRKEIDKYLDKLFKGEIDDANGDVLDNLIVQMTHQAIKVLEHQRTEHRDLLKSFDIRRSSDRKTFEKQLLLLQEDLKKNQVEQEEYRNRMLKNEFC